MYNNKFGKYRIKDNILNIIINEQYSIKDIEEFIAKLEIDYKNIQSNFKLIADVSLIKMNMSIYSSCKIVAKFFASNYAISEKYLENICIISSNSMLKKILKIFCDMYEMPHPISIINN